MSLIELTQRREGAKPRQKQPRIDADIHGFLFKPGLIRANPCASVAKLCFLRAFAPLVRQSTHITARCSAKVPVITGDSAATE